MPTSNYPSAYKQFKAITDLYKHSENKLLFGRFVYRYRLARSFDGIIADGIGRTLTGYNAILKVFLAYTAYEQLLKGASGLHVYQLGSIKTNRVVDLELASRLRMNKKLIDSLINYSTDSKLVGELVAFRKEASDDITCVAYAIRNIFAHGDLTATSTALAATDEVVKLIGTYDLSSSTVSAAGLFTYV